MQQIARRQHWLATPIDDEMVMMNVESGRYMGLSRIGSRVWQLIERPSSIEAIVERLTQEYDVTPEQCRSDVERFIAFMIDQGAVEAN